MLLDDLSDFMSSGGMGIVYKDQTPLTPDTVTAVYAQIGQPPTYTMRNPHVLEQPRVQVVCRSVSLETAHDNARSAYELLSGVRNRTINGVLYHWIGAAGEPVLIGKDQNARFTVACNFDIKKDRST
jgi:Bacteriophage minor capsid protein